MGDRKLVLAVLFRGIDNSLSPALRAITGNTGKAKAGLKAMSAEVKAQQLALARLNESIKNYGTPTEEMLHQQKRLETQIAATNAKIKSQRDMMAKQASADAKGEKLRSSGRGQMALGIGLAVSLLLAAKAGADFQDGMTDIQQKADLTVAETQKLEKNIIAAAAAAKQLPESMRQGVDVLAGFGMTPAQAAQMISPIGRAATAYEAEIADLSAASFANFDNLKVPINETATALDIMAAAGKSGAFEIKDMAQFFPALTASAQGLGQHGTAAVADLAAALEIARKGAGSAEAAANNVQNLLAKINTKDTIKNFKAFGIDLPKAMKKAYAEGKTPIEAIAELTKKATGGDLSKMSFLFGDMQVQQALRPLIQNIDEYRKIRGDAMKAVGTVDADFALRAKNANANTVALEGSMAKLALTIGDKLLPRLTPLVDDATKIITAIGDWADKHPHLTDVIVTTAAAVAVLNIAMGTGKVLYGSVVGPLTMAANAFTALRTSALAASIVSGVTSGIAAAWGVISGAAAVYVPAMFSAAAATWAVAWPVLAVIAACVLVAAAIAGVIWAIYHWDKVQAWFGGVWDKIKSYFLSIDWLKLGGDMLMGLVNGLLGGIPMLLVAIGKVAGSIKDHFTKKLDIHSPSRVFMGYGNHIAEGLQIGIGDNMHKPFKQVGMMAAGVAGAMTMAGGTPAYAAPPVQFGNIEIHIHAAPGQSPEAIAAAVRRELENLAREKTTAARSQYRDDDA